MKLKTVVFYQSVKSWDGNEMNTFKESESQIIELEDHLVKMTREGSKDVIIVPTANMRFATTTYQECFSVGFAQDETFLNQEPLIELKQIIEETKPAKVGQKPLEIKKTSATK